MQPDIAVYHSNYGNILYHSNNLEFAIQEHKRAIKLDKKNFQSFYGLGVIYSHLKNYQFAEENYLKALSIDSESSVAHNNLANIYNQINPKKAEIKTKELLNNLGIAYLATKQNDKSKAMFEAALQIDPEYKPAKDNLENIKNIN